MYSRTQLGEITRDTKFGQRLGKNPQGGTPFEILILLDFHKMFSKDYNEPTSINKNQIKSFDLSNKSTN